MRIRHPVGAENDRSDVCTNERGAANWTTPRSKAHLARKHANLKKHGPRTSTPSAKRTARTYHRGPLKSTARAE